MPERHVHSHFHPADHSLNRAFIIGISLNVLYTVVEFIFGFLYDSLALISDASHNLSDVGSLIVSLAGFKLAEKAANHAYTYGYKKATIMASLINSVFLVIIVIGIIAEALERLRHPPEITGWVIMLVAGIGVGINAVSAFFFHKDQKEDINIRGAFIHLLADALVSVGVVLSGAVIYFTGWNIVDPVISIVIAVVVLFSTYGLLKESVRLSIDAVPKEIDYEEIKQSILSVPGVAEVHHIHIWAISSSINALTAHIRLDSGADVSCVKKAVRDELFHEKIQHVTLETELPDEKCLVVDDQVRWVVIL